MSASYDGNIVAFAAQPYPAGMNIYVHNISAGTTVLASRNDSGGPTVGNVADMQLSADGNAVVFEAEQATDISHRSSCSDTSVYRYDVASDTLAYLNITPSAPANIPQVTSVACADSDAGPLEGEASLGMSVSDNGDRVALIADLSLVCPGCYYNPSPANAQLVVVDASASGTTSARWYSADTARYAALFDFSYIYGVHLYTVIMSGDGNTIFTVYQQPTTDEQPPMLIPPDPLYPDNTMLRIDVDRFTSQPVHAMALPQIFGGFLGLSGNGRIAITEGLSRNQVFALDTTTGGIALLSQNDGAMANGTSYLGRGGIDENADRVVFSTDAPNLFGLDGTPSGNITNVIVVGLTDLPIVLPDATQGCQCADSLAATAPLQNLVGDPVNSATGAFTEADTDGGVPTPGVAFTLQRTYDSSNSVVGPLGPGWSIPYGMSLTIAAGGNITLTAEDGAQGVFTRLPDGTYQASPGVNSTLHAAGSTYVVTLPSQQKDTFDAAGRLTTMVDRSGKGLAFHYTGTALTSVTDAAGGTSTFTYDSSTGRLTRVAFADQRSVTYAYTTAGLLSSVTAVDGSTTTYGYDVDGQLTTITDADGKVITANTYTAGRVTKQVTDDGAHTATLAWDASAQVATYTSPTGGVSKDYYSNNVLLRHVDPDGGTTSYTYDSHLDVVSMTDPDGHTTTMTYDGAGSYAHTNRARTVVLHGIVDLRRARQRVDLHQWPGRHHQLHIQRSKPGSDHGRSDQRNNVLYLHRRGTTAYRDGPGRWRHHRHVQQCR